MELQLNSWLSSGGNKFLWLDNMNLMNCGTCIEALASKPMAEDRAGGCRGSPRPINAEATASERIFLFQMQDSAYGCILAVRCFVSQESRQNRQQIKGFSI
jgi:hypothetical protein